MDIVRRSILFEIVNKGTRQKPIEAFTLIIPPENIEIDEPQRIAYTKTFGGIFIDDYGADQIKISISGHTGNTRLKKTFVPSDTVARVPEKMNGQDGFFYFRDKLMRYKNQLKNYDKYEMIIYDLSLIPEKYNTPDGLNLNYITEGYVVNLDRFKMTRNKEKPLFFNYSIEMTVTRPLGTPLPTYANPTNIAEAFTLITAIRKSLNTIKSILGRAKNIKDKIENYITLVGQVDDQLKAFYNQTVDILTYPASLCKLALSTSKDLVDSIQGLGENGAANIGIVLEDYWSIIQMAQGMNQTTAALVTKSKEPNSYANSFVARTSVDLTAVDASISKYEGLTDLQTEIFSDVSNVDTSKENVLSTYGYALVTVTAETSLESLALEYYGDPSLQEIIALYNKLDGVEDLEIGSVIRIPVLSQFVSVPGNYIYSSFINDVFGSDIKLDQYYNPVVGESGDFLSISDTLNVIQALNLRLNEELGTRLRLIVYGIKGAVGGPANSTSPIAYIVNNIKDSVLQDPRIESIENMLVKGLGDQLYISFNSYTIKRGEVIPFHNTL